MRLIRITVVLVALAIPAAIAAQARSSAQLYEEALRKERTDGDLPAAIGLYQRVAAGTDRELAARALIRVGGLYERQGREEALRAYQRVLTEFADQPEPARVARARLTALAAGTVDVGASGALTIRQLLLGEDFDPSGMPTADGRFLTFTDWKSGGNVALYELATGGTRLLTRSAAVTQGGGYSLGSSVSRDGKRIAYFWTPPNPRSWLPQVRVINSDGTGERTLFANEDSSVTYVDVHEFTPDGAAVSVVLYGPEGLVRIGLLSTADGRFQLLREMNDAGFPLRIAVSPDGRWIAFDEIADTMTVRRDVVVVTREGRETARIRHPMGNQNPIWTPDGRHLLFSSARAGAFGLWAVRFAQGAIQGQPVEVKSQMPWGFSPRGFAGSELLYLQDTGGGDVFAVDFDQASGRVTGTPVNLLPAYQGMNMKGVWTQDGRKLIYASRRGAVSEHSLGRLVVRDMATGEEKEFARPNLNPVISRLAPSPDGRYVVSKVNGLAGPADQMLQLIDTHTGEIRTLTRSGPTSGLGNAVWSRDGRAVYYNRRGQEGNFLVRHDLASGATTRTTTPGSYAIALSPAGDSVLQPARKGNAIHLHIGPVAGGEFRTIAQLSDFGDPLGTLNRSGVVFTPDGKRVVFARATRTDPQQPWGNAELFTVPVGGGEPQSAGLVLREIRGISFAPDGRLTFTAERTWKNEIWSMANIASRLSR